MASSERGRWLDSVIDQHLHAFDFRELCRAHDQIQVLLQVLVQHFHREYRHDPPPDELIRLFKLLSKIGYVKLATQADIHSTKG
jgi:hypothetical protein